MTYSTIVFDAGGTLLHMDYDALARVYVRVAATRGVPVSIPHARAVLEALENEMPQRQRQRAVSLEADNGARFWDEFFGDGFRRLGVLDDVTREVTEIRTRFQRGEFETLYDDVVPTLDALRAQGKQLGILSNFSPNLEDVLRALRIHAYFSFFIVSGIVGVEKPDARIFDLMVHAARVPRHEIVYIGDSVFHDVQGARVAGLAAILLDRYNQHPEFNGARVRTLREVV
ncbi:MAG: HAD-IA family hydrolase [Anaerolineae bacterium]|nr:HAD-IA family hydrolase [Anaerolineae bacterium]